MQIINMFSVNNLYAANASTNSSGTLADTLGIDGNLLFIMIMVFIALAIVSVAVGISKGVNKRESKRILDPNHTATEINHDAYIISDELSPRELTKKLNQKFIKDLYGTDELENTVKKETMDEKLVVEKSDKYKQWR